MENKNIFRIVPISEGVAQVVRENRRDQIGNSVKIVRDGNPHQCRVCLRLSSPDEGVILLAYKPFESSQPYAESGPIFIHERECEPYSDSTVYPSEFPKSAVVLRGYSDEDAIVDAQAVGGQKVENVITEMFSNQKIAYLHARNLGYGCYMFRIDRG